MCLCTFTNHRSHKKAQNINEAKIILGGTCPRAPSYNPSYDVIHCWQWRCHVNWLSEHVFIDTCVFVFILFLYWFFYSQFQQMWKAYSFQWSHCFSAIQYCSRFSDILPVSAVWVNLLTNKLCVWRRWEVDICMWAVWVPVDHTRLECVVHKHSNITCLLHYDLYIAIRIYIHKLRIDHSLMYNMQTWGPGFDSQWLLVFQALFPSCPRPQFMIQSRALPAHASQ